MIMNVRRFTIIDMTLDSVFENEQSLNFVSIPEFLAWKAKKVFEFSEQNEPINYLRQQEDFCQLLHLIRCQLLSKDPSFQRLKVVFGNMPSKFSRMLEERLIQESIEPLYYTYIKEVGKVNGEHIIVNQEIILVRPYKELFTA